MAAEEWSEKDYQDMWSAMRNETENAIQRVQSGPAEEVLPASAQAVYVVIFNEGTENEGVYTLQSKAEPGKNYLLTFDDKDDADRFAGFLEGEGMEGMDGSESSACGKPLMWDTQMIKEYCNSCAYAVTHVPVGVMFTPPRSNGYDEDAFRALEIARQSPDQRASDEEVHGLNKLISERQMFERLYGNGFSP
jgi:hypothetical protein